MEEWRDIKGFEGKYMVSNLGRVKSLNYRRTGKEKILKAFANNCGYLRVMLCKDGKSKLYLVHVLVAIAFCENPEGYTDVNHINEVKSDNRAENLEFCSRSYNNTYNNRAKKVAEKTSKPVFSINKKSGLIMWWKSASEASRQLDISQGSICNCCNGKRYKSVGGYIWFFAD